MNKIYTIVDIVLECKEGFLNIPLAICYEENGIYLFDTCINDIEFYKKCRNSFLTLRGMTDSYQKIEAYGLFISNFKTPSKAATLACDRFIKIIEPWAGKFNEETNVDKLEGIRVFGIELEGLKIKFSDRTEIERYRKSGKIDDILNFKFDHNHCELLLNDELFNKNYSILFTANPKNENIFIEFVSKSGCHDLFYEDYKKIRPSFIQFLSFINGAPILLRKEFTGTFHGTVGSGNIYSEITAIYSHKPMDKLYYSDYLPINDGHSLTEKILPILMLQGFNNYYKHNKALDLNSLVASINEAYQTTGSKEQYYILITALEKVINNFNKTNKQLKTLVDPSFFDNTLKAELLHIIENHKALIKAENKTAFDIYKSRIGGLNRIKENDNKQKFYQFFDFCKIEVSPYLSNLIEVERNQAVHEGKIGDNDTEALVSYQKLDHLLRDIVLNLMDYNRIRKPKVAYQSPFPYSTPWST